MKFHPLTKRRLASFRVHRRAFPATLIFILILILCLPAEMIANDKPIAIKYEGQIHFPIFKKYTDTHFGGTLKTEADYRDPYLKKEITKNGWMIWSPIRYSAQTIIWNLPEPAPTPPSWKHPLGTDDQARDVLARLIYGLRISITFGLILTVVSAIFGVAAGAIQGYFGGWVDLLAQRGIEVWSSMPTLYILIILSSLVIPNFWWLMTVMLLFSWIPFVGGVRAEILKVRNLDYVRAARALGVRDLTILFRHALPNAMVVTLTIMPFSLSGAIVVLVSLDFLGIGLPPGSASLGELLAQGKANLHAPWLGLTGFFSIAILLCLLLLIGEGIRDALDPRKGILSQGK